MFEKKETRDESKKRFESICKSGCGKGGGFTVSMRNDGRLCTEQAGKTVALEVRPCFPWSRPGEYISLRDDAGNEVALVKELGELDKSSRGLVELALAEAGFVMEIESVLSRQEEFEVRSWNVRTKQGERRFQTKRDAWPDVLLDGGLLIRDVAGDLFYVRDPESMDAVSKKYLEPFMD